jgi:hypothetical protein
MTTSNSPSLRERRRSYRAGAGPARFAPVGPVLTACDTDTTCQTCGYMVCAPNCADGYPSTAAWHAPKPAAEARCISATGNGGLAPQARPSAWDGLCHCGPCNTERARIHRERPPATPADEALAPGWSDSTKPEYGQARFSHASGMKVWQRTDLIGWVYGPKDAVSATCPRSGEAPTRDEAMALALGWERVNGTDWQLKGAANGMCASVASDGIWFAIPAQGRGRAGFPSLPHAVAWAMGHE